MSGKDRNKKNRLIALVVTIALHSAVVAILFFIFLSASVPEERGGIIVNIGDAPMAAGMFVPHQLETDYIPQMPDPQPQVDEPFLTQDTDTDAPEITEQKKDKQYLEEQRLKEQRRLEEQKRQKELEEQRKRDKIKKDVQGAFGNTANKGSGNDNSATSGNAGSPNGNVSSGGVNTGVGGFGSFALGGRSLAGSGLQRPEYNVQEEGDIVIKITVNPRGEVIQALIGPGTTIGNSTLRNNALRAAKATRFNAVDEVNNQTGTITYRFRLK